MYTIKQQVALCVFHRNWNVPTHETQFGNWQHRIVIVKTGFVRGSKTFILLLL